MGAYPHARGVGAGSDGLREDDALRFVAGAPPPLQVLLVDDSEEGERSLYLERALSIGTAPSWGIFGTAFRAQLTKAWEVRVRVDNLLDAEYETFVGFPGAPRTARVDFRVKARSFVE